MRSRPHRALLLCAATAAVALPGLTPGALGAAKTYTPTSASDTFNLDSNWQISGAATTIPTAVDQSGDSADFSSAGVTTITDPVISVDTGADQAVTAIRFPVNTQLPAGQSWVINNNTITLYGLTNNNGVVYQVGTQVIINSNLRIANDEFFYSGGGGGAGITYNGVISEVGGSKQLTRNQSGTATFTNPNNSFTGGLVITDGTLRAMNDGTLGAPYDGSLGRITATAGSGYTAAPTITIAGGGGTGASATATLSGSTVSSVDLTSAGTGYTSLPTVTVTGGTAGTKSAATPFIKGQVTIKTGGTLTLGAAFDTNRPILLGTNANGQGTINTGTFDSTFSGVLSPASGFAVSSLVKSGAGSLTLTAPANTYNGGTIVSAGTLRVASDAQLGAPYTTGAVIGFFVTNGGSGYTSPATVTFVGSGTGVSATATVGTGTNAGIITAVSLKAGGSGYVYAPAATITGGSGTGATAAAYVQGLLTLRNGATLQTTAPLTSNRPVVLGGTGTATSTITLDTNGFDSTLTGVLNNGASGTGALAKSGAGTLTLTGANTYTGLTTVNAGTLLLGPAAQAPVLSPAGADVKAGRLVLDYTGNPSPAPAVLSQITAGAIKTSNASATQTIGMLDDGASKVTVAFTYYGDANLDGKLNADDFALLDRGFAKGLTGWANGDFNYSGAIDSADYLLLDSTYGTTGVPHDAWTALLSQRESQFGDAYVQSLIAAVPEPASLTACALALRPLTRRRRK